MNVSQLCLLGFASLSVACGSSSERGVSLRVVSRPVGLEAGQRFENDLGQSLKIERAFFTTVAFELLPCKSALRTLWDLAVPSARAHGVSTPTRRAVPVVQDALSSESFELGELSPPAGRYCGLVLELGPADSDAERLDEAQEMLRKSLRLEGAAEGGEFELESSKTVESTLEIELRLDESERELTVTLEHDVQRWFDGIDFEHDDESERENRALENWARAITAHVD